MQLDILHYYHHSATCNWTYCITITIVQHATGHTALLSHYCNMQLDILHYYHTSAACNWTYCITITPVQLATEYTAPVTCYVTVIPYCQPAVSLANVHTSYQIHASFRCRPCFVLHTNKVNCGFDSIYWRGGSVHTSNQRL